MLLSMYNVSYKQQCLQLCPKRLGSDVRVLISAGSLIDPRQSEHMYSKYVYIQNYLKAFNAQLTLFEGDTRQRPATHAVLHHRHLHGLVLLGQPHPGHRRHVVRRLSETGSRRRRSRRGRHAGLPVFLFFLNENVWYVSVWKLTRQIDN